MATAASTGLWGSLVRVPEASQEEMWKGCQLSMEKCSPAVEMAVVASTWH